MMAPVYDGGSDDCTREDLLPAHHHLQSQEGAIVLTVETDLVLINWIVGRDGS